jgi:hypothetical protein
MELDTPPRKRRRIANGDDHTGSPSSMASASDALQSRAPCASIAEQSATEPGRLIDRLLALGEPLRRQIMAQVVVFERPLSYKTYEILSLMRLLPSIKLSKMMQPQVTDVFWKLNTFAIEMDIVGNDAKMLLPPAGVRSLIRNLQLPFGCVSPGSIRFDRDIESWNIDEMFEAFFGEGRHRDFMNLKRLEIKVGTFGRVRYQGEDYVVSNFIVYKPKMSVPTLLVDFEGYVRENDEKDPDFPTSAQEMKTQVDEDVTERVVDLPYWMKEYSIRKNMMADSHDKHDRIYEILAKKYH